MINDILPEHPKIVCHRGAETFAPENTLSAIDLAIGLGFNIVEIDVRQTKDGVPVVLHAVHVALLGFVQTGAATGRTRSQGREVYSGCVLEVAGESR